MVGGDQGYFEVCINGDAVCTAFTDQQQTASDAGQAASSAVVYITEGVYRCVYFGKIMFV